MPILAQDARPVFSAPTQAISDWEKTKRMDNKALLSDAVNRARER